MNTQTIVIKTENPTTGLTAKMYFATYDAAYAYVTLATAKGFKALFVDTQPLQTASADEALAFAILATGNI